MVLFGMVFFGIAGADDSITDSGEIGTPAGNPYAIPLPPLPKACKDCITGGKCPPACSKYAPPDATPPQDDSTSIDDSLQVLDILDVKSELSGYSINEVLGMSQKGLLGQNPAFRAIPSEPAPSNTGGNTAPSQVRSSGCACGR